MGSLLKSYRRHQRRSVLRKVVNSYLTPRFFYETVYGPARWQAILSAADKPGDNARTQQDSGSEVSIRMAGRLLWFWPTDEEDIKPWISAGPDSRKGYSKFIDGTPCDELFCNVVEQYCADRGCRILELGSNVGRIISILMNRGYSRIRGVELNRKAIDASSGIFGREVSEAITRDALQPFLMKASDGEFDCVITYGATIELIHPAFDVIRHMCRVSRARVIICVNENQHSFPRFYRTEFERHGFYTCYHQRAIGEICSTDTENSIMVFERISSD